MSTVPVNETAEGQQHSASIAAAFRGWVVALPALVTLTWVAGTRTRSAVLANGMGESSLQHRGALYLSALCASANGLGRRMSAPLLLAMLAVPALWAQLARKVPGAFGTATRPFRHSRSRTAPEGRLQ